MSNFRTMKFKDLLPGDVFLEYGKVCVKLICHRKLYTNKDSPFNTVMWKSGILLIKDDDLIVEYVPNAEVTTPLRDP